MAASSTSVGSSHHILSHGTLSQLDSSLSSSKYCPIRMGLSDAVKRVKSLYEKTSDPKTAAFAYLSLAAHQLEENNVPEAIKILESSQESDPNLKIRSLLVGLRLLSEPTQQNIKYAKQAAFGQSDEEKIAIYKEVIAHDPSDLEAYGKLIPLLQDPAEKRHFLFTAADRVQEAGNGQWASVLRKQAEEIPIPPAPITPKKLASPAPAVLVIKQEPHYLTGLPKFITPEDWASPAALMAKLEPYYPAELKAFLASPSPFYASKKATETHGVAPLFRNITTTVDGALVVKPSTLRNIDAFVKSVGGSGCKYIREEALGPNIDTPPEAELEFLVYTKEPFPRSTNLTYDEQIHLLESKGYEAPGFRDFVYCLLWEERISGRHLYSSTYTRCVEKVEYTCPVQKVTSCPLFIGRGSILDGPSVRINSYHSRHLDIGMAGIRKFQVR